MIEEKKLWCAFIYSAYESGYCGLKLAPEMKGEHMGLYRKFLKDGEYFPAKEIEETQAKMMEEVNGTSLRDYVYVGHFDVVKKRIETETGLTFERVISGQNAFPFYAAMNCPVNFYTVLSVEGSRLRGKNLFTRMEKELIILDGLERPNIGDVVSGHWNYLLEITSDDDTFRKYRDVARTYFDATRKIRRANEKK